ncbi:hypothetical protein LUZ63_020794 [Rhynchospora breviuscula]|uniref:N-acetyltransferase domain-containing protein n=1 Tax=Rhynchospora breviuscula TaxID=2022672 RepID=A0A9P9Z7X5_9POAL|nr:hypothetical protein LUZ63_020794 [Rhynchospora breviuscula]
MVQYRGDPEVCRFLPFEPQTADDIRARIGHVFGQTSLEGERGGVVMAVERRSDGAVIGDLVLFHLDPDAGSAEIGWVMHPEAAGRGLATEAVRALLDTAFDVYGLRRVIARIAMPTTTVRGHWRSVWACAERPIWSRTNGSRAGGATRSTTRCSRGSGPHGREVRRAAVLRSQNALRWPASS